MHGEESSGAHGVGRHVITAELSSSPLMEEKHVLQSKQNAFKTKVI